MIIKEILTRNYKYKPGTWVVCTGIVYEVQTVWSNEPISYDLIRLYPKSNEVVIDIPEGMLKKWDGTILK